jgi:tRNA A-37 threonylcarbamoyl transferase component Bud32
MTGNEVKALRKMRGMGEGGYGALPRRRRGGRADAAGEKRLGKPCGNSYISREYKCSVSTSGRGQDWGKAAMMVGAVAGGAIVAHELRRRSGDWWKDHKWDTSAEQVEKEFQEAVAGGQKWDEFERRKAAYEAACAKTDAEEQKPEDSSVQQLDLDLGKRKAPARLDGWRKANSCRGSGAFGSYYVHTSGKFGLKAFSDPDYDSQPEADMLEHANRIGVPSPRLMGYTGSVMKLEHLRGYKAVDSTNFGMGMQFGRDIPVEIKKNFIAAVKTMHLEGMAHNDLHMGNIMVGLASRRVKLIDFGLASLRSDTENAVPFRDGRGSNLLKEELSSIPYKLNLPDATTNLVQTRYKRALQLVEDIADSENGYGRARNRSGINLHWDTAEFIINRYYNDLTRAVEAQPVARSRSVASVIQPKLPGLDRARLKARWNTEQAAGLQGWGKDALYDIAQQMGVAPSAFESFLLSAKNKK